MESGRRVGCQISPKSGVLSRIVGAMVTASEPVEPVTSRWGRAHLSGFGERADQRLSRRKGESCDRVNLRHSGIGQCGGPLIGAWRITESSDRPAPRRLDVMRLALITVGICLFTLTFDPAPSWGRVSAGRSSRSLVRNARFANLDRGRAALDRRAPTASGRPR
jgi:hypothetical protein